MDDGVLLPYTPTRVAFIHATSLHPVALPSSNWTALMCTVNRSNEFNFQGLDW
jgi:hypothetical protein